MNIDAEHITLFSYPSLISTMDEGRRIAETGLSGVGIVRADTQTAGRGRIVGRQWMDAPGQSLLMTIVLPEGSTAIQALPLRVGLGVARALEGAAGGSGAPLDFQLKWPNDVLAARRDPEHIGRFGRYGKICGILCETAGRRALAGIGINVKRTALNATGFRFPSLSIEEALGAVPPPFDDLDGAARVVGRAVLDALVDPCWKRDYEARIWGRGERLRFLAGHPDHPDVIEGLCEGVGDDGSIILNIHGNRSAFASGEISASHCV